MLRWEIEATIISKDDASDIFPDVRLGDPVRGTLMYDAARESDCYSLDCLIGIQNEYEHPRWLDVVTMVIENPRTGGETRFMKDLDGRLGGCPGRRQRRRELLGCRAVSNFAVAAVYG